MALDDDATRRLRVAPSLGQWLQYLRKHVTSKQLVAAAEAGISLDAVRRLERGENVSIGFLLPFLSWLDDELATAHPNRHQEFRAGLFDRLLEDGGRIRRKEKPTVTKLARSADFPRAKPKTRGAR